MREDRPWWATIYDSTLADSLETSKVSTLGIGETDVGREYIEVVKGSLQRFFVLNFNDKVMNRFVEHQIITSLKKLSGDYHRHFKKYSDPVQASSPCRFYNDNTCSLRNKVSQSTVSSSYSRKHILIMSNSFRKPLRMRCDRATQKVLVADPSPCPPRVVLAILQPPFCKLGSVEEAKVLIEQQRVKLEKAKRMMKEQRRTSELYTQQMEEMKKIIEEMSRA
ncbi:CACTA en-spm transposon protein [Cucumis melo var. makuwa]|uniref:CACTA en-spm transposon protein n=1 Tax=Cucumis melo var. makuwa TaxID=1194695 RepID=A0A5D3E486_CUCMM|nr:CACTA en-spm transposon protein [Cucumis melo var. makuwa]